MKYILLLLVGIVFLLAACGGTEITEATAYAPLAEATTAVSETKSAVPTESPIPATMTKEQVPTAVTEISEETETAVAPSEPPIPTAVLPVATEASIQVVSGQLPDGAFFLGDANAPLTVIDYSDFL